MNKKIKRAQLEELYTFYEQKVYRVAYNVLRSVEQAEDVTQETFLLLYQKLDHLSGLEASEQQRYLLRVAKNKAIDYYRKNKKQLDFLSNYQKRQVTAEDNVASKMRLLISEEQIEMLLKVLPESYQQVFMYRVFYGFSTKEVAELTDLSEVNVRKQYERAKKKIISLIGGMNDDIIRETFTGIS